MKTFAPLVALFALLSLTAPQAYAGPYADELSKCLVESTSTRDRPDLVRWMSTSAALHPAVKPISNVTDQELFASPEVAAGLSGPDKYFDEEKLGSLKGLK